MFENGFIVRPALLVCGPVVVSIVVAVIIAVVRVIIIAPSGTA